MTGTLNFGGFRMANQPDISGTIKITNAKGSITIELSGSGAMARSPNARFALNALDRAAGPALLQPPGNRHGQRLVRQKHACGSITTPSPIGGNLTLSLNLKPPIR